MQTLLGQSCSGSSRPRSALPLCLTTCAVFALSGCSPPRSPEPDTPERAALPSGESLADTLARLLRQAVALDATAAAVWPGFDLRSHVLIVAHQPEGPTALVGDSPPPPWRAVDARHDIFLLDGPPPDSLAGLRTALTWTGRPNAATALSYRADGTLSPLVHEAFHTHQRRVAATRPGSFGSGATPNYPDTSIDAVALAIAESRLLADALGAPTVDSTRRRVLASLAARVRRCRRLGSRECASERDIERNEGTATYVAARVMEGHADIPSLDSLRALLARFADLTRLRRWHFYDTGLAWLTLLDRVGPKDWKAQIEIAPPDSVLASFLGLTSQQADSLWAVIAAMPLWAEARQNAERLIRTELALRDSVHRAFWAQAGTLVKVYWKSAGSMRSEWRPVPGQVARGFAVSDSTRGPVGYAVGLAESTIRFDSRRNWITVRGLSATLDVPSPAFVAITPVVGRSARVDNRVVPLDRPAAAVGGQVSFQLDHIEVMLENASLEVFADSVIVRMH